MIRIYTVSTNIWTVLPICVVYDIISLMLCCNRTVHSQLQGTAHVLLSRALNTHLHQRTRHV